METQNSDESIDSSITEKTLQTLTYHPNVNNVSVLPWDRFSQWVYCICVVTFDLELGQAMEVNALILVFSFFSILLVLLLKGIMYFIIICF